MRHGRIGKFVARANKQKVESPEGFPLLFPSKLNLDEERPVVDECLSILRAGAWTLEDSQRSVQYQCQALQYEQRGDATPHGDAGYGGLMPVEVVEATKIR